MLRCCSLIVLCALALDVHAQASEVAAVRVEPYAGGLWGEPNADTGDYRRDLTGGVRILKMYGYDRGVYLEGWLLRSQHGRFCCAVGTYTRAAFLAGVSSTLIDPNATGGLGLRMLAGLGVLRVDYAPDADERGGVQYYELTLDTWNAVFSGSVAFDVELLRGVMLQLEAGYVIMYVLHGGDPYGYDEGFFASFWAPSFRGVAGVAFEL